MVSKCYSELKELKTFEERFNYLKLDGHVGFETFGAYRYLNQRFYHSKDWKEFSHKILIRDGIKDLGLEDCGEGAIFVVHHIVPVTLDDLVNKNLSVLLNPENAITVRDITHKAIHYGDMSLLFFGKHERHTGDTCPWKG